MAEFCINCKDFENIKSQTFDLISDVRWNTCEE